jgi:hypothetical protein
MSLMTSLGHESFTTTGFVHINTTASLDKHPVQINLYDLLISSLFRKESEIERIEKFFNWKCNVRDGVNGHNNVAEVSLS